MAEPEMIGRVPKSAENHSFIGHDGRSYATRNALEQANTEWIAQNNRFKSNSKS